MNSLHGNKTQQTLTNRLPSPRNTFTRQPHAESHFCLFSSPDFSQPASHLTSVVRTNNQTSLSPGTKRQNESRTHHISAATTTDIPGKPRSRISLPTCMQNIVMPHIGYSIRVLYWPIDVLPDEIKVLLRPRGFFALFFGKDFSNCS
jgi:hypothetical protein